MVVPKWASTKTQPIAIDDVVRYLVGVCGQEKALGRVFEIGGPDQLTYVDMLRVAAEVGKGPQARRSSRCPVLTPRLSSYWLALVTDVDVTTGRNLIDSMGTEVLVSEQSIREVVPGEPLTYGRPYAGRWRSARGGLRLRSRGRGRSPAARRASPPTTSGG